MKLLLRLSGLCALLFWLTPALAQVSDQKVSAVDIKYIGPPAASEQLVRANIRVKAGQNYSASAVDDDIHNLYATGLFYNIRVVTDRDDLGGLKLVYVLQGRPRLTAIKIRGNKKYTDAKIRKKITSKVGEPLDERKLFTDALAIEDMYHKAGYSATKVESLPPNIDEEAGRGTATIQITETPKVKILRINFIGAHAFTPKKLAHQIKTKKKWMWTWLTARGIYKEDQFQDDRELLTKFYRDHGYLDFEIKDVRFEHPSRTTMVIDIYIDEGRQYRVGQVTFKGATLFPTNTVNKTFKLKPGAVYVADDLDKDVKTVEDFYGAKGYIDVSESSPTGDLQVRRIPNTDTGTMDLEYDINEGQKSYIEKIDIRGNTKTKDRVIRRELAISPGEVFDMVRVNISKKRLENLQYFEKVDLKPEPTDVPNRKNLIVGVEEKNTGNFSVGAGFSSIDSLVAFAEVSQGNFDLFHPPTFTGGGQKFRLRVQLGTERQDYIATFVEPWFLGKKLSLSVEAYLRDLDFQSVNNIYDEHRAGVATTLTRALGSDFLIGSIGYTIENVDITLNSGWHDNELMANNVGRGNSPVQDPANVPTDILDEVDHPEWISKIIGSLSYDTRNNTLLPNGGERTTLSGEMAGGPLGGGKDYYKLELKTSWFFPGLMKGDVIEVDGQTGVADGLGSGETVPFYERWYLGGLYSLRGFGYRRISPRQYPFNEPIGGDTYWFGSTEYSIPIYEKEKGVGVRVAAFYDIGAVNSGAYDYNGDFSADWGFGLRLNLPIGPLRLDYGIPIQHDQYSGSSGRFQFGVGYTREF